MKCLICGKEIDNQVVCEECRAKVTEDLCYRVARYNDKVSDGELWAEIVSYLGNVYKFRELSLDLAEILNSQRSCFVKIRCMNLMNTMSTNNRPGVHKKYSNYVMEHADECFVNKALSYEEKNYVKALLFGSYVINRSWDSIGNLPREIDTDTSLLEPSLILAEYYMIIAEYDIALELLDLAKEKFCDNSDQERIDIAIADCKDRKFGNKDRWRPKKRADKEIFYKYLDKLGVEHSALSNDRRNKVSERDFQPFNRTPDIPDTYVALWITSEFAIKVNESVEISAVRVQEGELIDTFHSFIRPTNYPRKPVHVKEEDYKNAPCISDVFSKFIEFLKDDVIASAGFDEQQKLLSRLARYSKMDHIDNKIFDAVEFGEDLEEDIVSYTRSTLLERYGVSEGYTGLEKAKATMYVIEKMR